MSRHCEAYEYLPDEFFEVTVDDIRKRFAQLKSQRCVRRKRLVLRNKAHVAIETSPVSRVLQQCLQQTITQFAVWSFRML